MDILRRIRFARFAILGFVAMGQVGCASNRVADGPPLQLHGGKFTYNSPEKESVHSLFSYDPAFVAVLDRHPAAMEEAQKGLPFHKATYVAALGMTVFGAKMFFNINQDGHGDTPGEVESSIESDLAIITGFSVAAGVLQYISSGYIKRAVSLFNTEEPGRSGQPSAPQALFRDLLGNLEFFPSRLPGGGSGLVARTRIPIR